MIDLSTSLFEHLSRQPAPSVADGCARASQAGGCARAIWYKVHQEPESNPTPLTGYLSMRIGSHLGRDLAEAMTVAHPGAVAEAYWELPGLSGHTDLLYRSDAGYSVVVKFKTVNPFAWRYLSEPKREHVLQLQLNAYGLAYNGQIPDDGNEPELRLIYLCIAAKQGDDPFLEFNPVFDPLLARAEWERLKEIAAAGVLPPPITDDVELDPLASKPDWHCQYCGHWDRCSKQQRKLVDAARGQGELLG